MTNHAARQDDVLPPPNWEPKSDFFKSIWKKVQFDLQHKRWHLQCPSCGQHVDLEVTVQETRKAG